MSKHSEKLDAVMKDAVVLYGTGGGGRALHKSIKDLEGQGPIGELLHTLDQERFNRVIDLLVEFRRSGRLEGFNALHDAARQRISPKEEGGDER
jgi:exopolyphosphatase/pppGpp-phosphohydrolase